MALGLPARREALSGPDVSDAIFQAGGVGACPVCTVSSLADLKTNLTLHLEPVGCCSLFPLHHLTFLWALATGLQF